MEKNLSLFSLSLSLFLSHLSVCLSHSQAVRGLLDNPNEPVSDLSYFDCIESVMENSKARLLLSPFPFQEYLMYSVSYVTESCIFKMTAENLMVHISLSCCCCCCQSHHCAGPGGVHGRDLTELQDWRRASVWRERGGGIQSPVWAD